jgi:hypothetical protein
MKPGYEQSVLNQLPFDRDYFILFITYFIIFKEICRINWGPHRMWLLGSYHKSML